MADKSQQLHKARERERERNDSAILAVSRIKFTTYDLHVCPVRLDRNVQYSVYTILHNEWSFLYSILAGYLIATQHEGQWHFRSGQIPSQKGNILRVYCFKNMLLNNKQIRCDFISHKSMVYPIDVKL